MDTRLLEYFVAVAEEQSFTRAATRLYVAQSTVSAGIRALETRLGAVLIERAARHVSLTAAGEKLLTPAREIIEATERLTTTASGRVEGRLRVGIFVNLPALDLPRLFAAFLAQHPLVQLRLVSSPSGSTGLADDLRRGRIDLAFMGLPAGDLPDLVTTELARSPLVALVGSAHPLAAEADVTLERLSREPFVDGPAGFGQRTLVERELARRGLSRQVFAEVSAVGDIPAFVAEGFGVALVPRILVLPTPGVVALRLADTIEWSLSASTRPHPAPAVVALRRTLVETMPVAVAASRQ
ncbi:LysR family transcriptional regulator [Microbacterium sp. SORGH_AS_0888]|uniref:LysR family transcriptional regulator n=1 Tax=Microbacterium sp. SORGH_AS_0888 TaxID=3041791 RepID=UPI0027D84247|nr:LysR family transcriptional regulator [Microbacterium sp. SORGH_AS_0888]